MLTIGAIGAAQLDAVLALNNASTPHVNALTAGDLQGLIAAARLSVFAAFDGRLAGFVLAFGPGADYASPNYRWFASRYPDFAYVDRIAVDPRFRGQGIARRLYDDVFALAGGAPVCCEVNLRPANETSMRFHLGLGMGEVGRQQVDDGAKEVALLATAAPPR